MQSRLTRSSFPAVFVLLMAVALAMTGCSDASDGTLEVGDDAPDFTLPAASGSTVSLGDYAGEPVLLYFHMADG
jgi:cytochrome oxidase Cu insertion factor (SCO1/SenC/PrrC family)